MNPDQPSVPRTSSPAQTLPMTHAQVRTNGVSLHVAQAGPETGPLVLLLHGFPEYWGAWQKTIPALVQAGFRVWVPDQRGYNLSDKPQGAGAYTLDHLAGDIVGLIDAAGATQAALVGHDWGASVTWWTANRHPERVSQMVAINAPHPAIWLRRIRESWSQRLKSSYMVFFQLPRVPEAVLRMGNWSGLERSIRGSARAGTFSDADFAAYRAAWSQPGAMTAMLNWYRALKRMPELPSLRIPPPALVLWGKNDAFAEPEVAHESAALCDDARVEVIEDATHWVHHEEPDRVNRLLLEFLAK
jgi:epoxide hydrolase 4